MNAWWQLKVRDLHSVYMYTHMPSTGTLSSQFGGLRQSWFFLPKHVGFSSWISAQFGRLVDLQV
jgi:hypothetical protein